MTPPRVDHVLALPGRDALALRPGRPLVMGILNATPDSFHDGDPAAGLEALLVRGLRLLEEGAAVLDVGGESTRPGAPAVDAGEETRRVVPLVEALRRDAPGCVISVDTSKAAVAGAALAAGADLVNDVTGLAGDPEMRAVVRDAGCPAVVMHMRGTPRTMARENTYDLWPPAAITAELLARVAEAEAAGIPRDRLVLDPGIGFAKDWRQSLEVLKRLDVLVEAGLPVLVGASRKSLLRHAAGTGTDTAGRLPGSLVLAVEAARRGAAMVRVHDVAETVQALRTLYAVEAGAAAEDLTELGG